MIAFLQWKLRADFVRSALATRAQRWLLPAWPTWTRHPDERSYFQIYPYRILQNGFSKYRIESFIRVWIRQVFDRHNELQFQGVCLSKFQTTSFLLHHPSPIFYSYIRLAKNTTLIYTYHLSWADGDEGLVLFLFFQSHILFALVLLVVSGFQEIEEKVIKRTLEETQLCWVKELFAEMEKNKRSSR